MSRLQTYLVNEGSRSKEISLDDARNMLHSQCSQSLKAWKSNNKSYIFRGSISRIKKYGYVNTDNFKERKSANTTNEYTLLINHILDSWKRYPKRSVICSTDNTNAASYGDNHYIFPFNNTKIGVCPGIDMWVSFTKSFVLGLLPTDINDFINSAYPNYKNVENLGKWLRNTRMSDISDDVSYKDKIDQHPDDLTLYDLFNDHLMNPDKNDFKLVKAGQPLPKEREVWFHGKALMVRYWPKDIIEELL